MVQIEINLAKEFVEVTKGQIPWVLAGVVSFAGAVYSEPEPWGVMGLVIGGIKHSVSTNKAKVRE